MDDDTLLYQKVVTVGHLIQPRKSESMYLNLVQLIQITKYNSYEIAVFSLLLTQILF